MPPAPQTPPLRPPRLLLQWHLTDRCNLRCSHCYQPEYRAAGLDFATWQTILAQFKSFIAAGPDRSARPAIRGHITVTGGEPFTRHDFPALLDLFAADQALYSFAILTNGTLIDADMARRLATWRPAFVQISLDGTAETHDRIRGTGNFARAVQALECLVSHNVPSVISFTAQRDNYREFAAVARLASELGVTRIWADRIIPEAADALGKALTAAETRELFELMAQARQAQRHTTTQIAMKRALQFLFADDAPYRCTAGDTLMTIMPNGDVYPCRRLPIAVGNLLETPLETLYDCATFRSLRAPAALPAACAPCAFASLCRGGLRCLSHAVTGDPLQRDPGCWLEM